MYIKCYRKYSDYNSSIGLYNTYIHTKIALKLYLASESIVHSRMMQCHCSSHQGTREARREPGALFSLENYLTLSSSM